MERDKADLRSILDRAREWERGFDWKAAAEEYSRACTLAPPEGLLLVGNLQESRAHALHRHAFQAETKEEFEHRSAEAVAGYETAKETYGRLGEGESTPWSRRCGAMVAFMRLWSERVPAERRRLIREAWDLAKQAMDAFEAVGDHPQLRKTNQVLTLAASLVYIYSADSKVREAAIREGLRYSDKALEHVSEDEEKADIARACIHASYYSRLFCSEVADLDQREQWDRRAGELWEKSVNLSEEGALDALLHGFRFGIIPSAVDSKMPSILSPKLLEYGEGTNDRLRMASAYEWKENRAFVGASEAIDPEVRDSLAQETLAFAEKSRACYSIFHSLYISEAIWWSGAPKVGFYALLSSLETDPAKKRAYAQSGVEAFEEGLKIAEECDYPETVAELTGDAAQILIDLAKTEKSSEAKKKVLERAEKLAGRFVSLWHSLHPKDYGLWATDALLADISHALAVMAGDVEEKIGLRRKALAHMKDACEGIRVGAAFVSKSLERWSLFRLCSFEYRVADWSLQLYGLSGDREDLSVASGAARKSIELCMNLDQPSRLAECCWKAAQIQDELGDFPEASESFEMAADSYRQAAERLPRLSEFYHDYMLHMQALSQTELAKHHRGRQEAAAAGECYRKASALYESTDRWRFLAPSYKALVEIEEGEDLSRKDRSRDAKAAFENAVRLYADAKQSLSRETDGIRAQSERDSVLMLIREAGVRQEHCKARAALEEAKQLDKEGRMASASEMYARVSEKFQSIRQGLMSDRDRRELDLIIILVNAWRDMARAEADSSPELYEKASLLFEQARDLSPNEMARNLATGNSQFCKALAAGILFTDTGDTSHHSTATKRLESASKYYLKAGVSTGSDYAKASKLLFDGYAYMGRASEENDEKKKAKLYMAAEKVLGASASSYERAGQPGKKEQVMKLVEKVREDKELAVSLAAVFLAPDVTSTTMAFSSPNPAHDTAVGMERFEHADVQAILMAAPREMQVRQEFRLEIELVNSGRGAAQLMLVEDAIPEGFELVQLPDKSRIEGSLVNLRGRKLDALKTEDVTLVLRPNVRGRFALSPRVVYVDESGKIKSCEPKPVEITIKEMGITGWLKGT